MEETVIYTENLTKRYGNFMAVDRVSLNVRRGEVYGFLGPNGAGKTTTIGMLLGLLYPSTGRIEILGEPVEPDKTRALRRVGSLVGAPGMVPHLSGRENLCLLARLNQLPEVRINAALEQVGMVDAADRKFRAYSMGMKQRIGLAAALLHEPELLILDEPTNGLDPAGMREVRELLRSLADQGLAVFLSSHLLHEVEQICDRVAVLKRGQIVAEGRVSELIGDQDYVQVRVDDPQAAFRVLRDLPGVQQITPNGSTVEVKGVSSKTIICHLVAHEVIPSEVTTRRSDLEHIFLELTQ